MERKRFNRGVKNIIYGLISQIMIMMFGLVVPRLFILNYGSETNGLLAFISQVFVYFGLLEVGLGTSTLLALYKPINANDKELISSIICASRDYYRRVAFYYFFCTVTFSFIYPIISNSNINKFTIFWIIILQGLSGACNYLYLASFRQFLTADGRNYVLSNVSLATNFISNVAKIILILLGANIIIIQIVYFIVSLISILIYRIYLKRNFGWIDLKAKPNNNSLTQKGSIFIHNLSAMIFNNTDIVVLTIFVNLSFVSIYSVYNMIITAVNSIIGTINGSLLFILGQTFHENKEKFIRLYDAYNSFYITFVFAMMSVCYVLFLPFIGLYTKGSDLNYSMKYLPLLFCLVQILSSIRMVSNNSISLAGHFKKTIPRSAIESLINLVCSITFVHIIGIYGVLIGTCIALLYRSNDMIIYSNIRILNRSPLKSYKPVSANFTLFFIVVLLNSKLNIALTSYSEFILLGIISLFTIVPVFVIAIAIFNKEEFKFVFDMLKGKLVKRTKKMV